MRIFIVLILIIIAPLPARAQEAAQATVQELPQDTAPLIPSIDLPPELDRILRDYETGWAAGDADALAGLFTDDGFVRSQGGWIRGHDSISEKYQNAGGPLRLRAVAYGVDATSGYMVGAYGYGAEEVVEDRGVFVLALRRADTGGPWLIAADLDNSITR